MSIPNAVMPVMVERFDPSERRSVPRQCECCGAATRERKPLCTLCVHKMPYVKRVLAGVAERDRLLLMVTRRDYNGLLAHPAVREFLTNPWREHDSEWIKVVHLRAWCEIPTPYLTDLVQALVTAGCLEIRKSGTKRSHEVRPILSALIDPE